jgi:hypothetical protein
LIDEAYHITFQTERLAIIFEEKSEMAKIWRKKAYKYFFYATSCLVWLGHKNLFRAGGITFAMYTKKMELKYTKTFKRITEPKAVLWI